VRVDFDPEARRALRGQDLRVYWRDGEDAKCVENLPLAQARWVFPEFVHPASRCAQHDLPTALDSSQVTGVPRMGALGLLAGAVF
jgi:hypothetical protein